MPITPQAHQCTDHKGETPHGSEKCRFVHRDENSVSYIGGLAPEILSSALTDLSALDGVNPALTRYGRKDPAPVLPLREEPDLLSWLETSGRLVEDEESNSPEVSTVEEEELSALMGEKEDYKADEENEENWED